MDNQVTIDGFLCPKCSSKHIFNYGETYGNKLQCQSCSHVFWSPKLTPTEKLRILIDMYANLLHDAGIYETRCHLCDSGWTYNKTMLDWAESTARDIRKQIDEMIQEVKDEVYNGIGE